MTRQMNSLQVLKEADWFMISCRTVTLVKISLTSELTNCSKKKFTKLRFLYTRGRLCRTKQNPKLTMNRSQPGRSLEITGGDGEFGTKISLLITSGVTLENPWLSILLGLVCPKMIIDFLEVLQPTACLGMYTVWLVPASFLGLIVAIYGFVTCSYPTVEQTCNSTFDACSTCESCSPAPINVSCTYSKLTRIFDNEMTIFFAIAMSFWATFFLEFWKRETAQLAYRWDVLGSEEEAERPRPQYCAKAKETTVNPITGKNEPYFPPSKRIVRYFSAWVMLSLMFVTLIIVLVGVILYRSVVLVLMLRTDLKDQSPVISSLTSSVINLIVILIMSFFYQKLARLLTDWETHRTDDDYNYHLTLKRYLFEFFNYYSSLFYIAFFKERFAGYPCKYHTTFGYRDEQCSVVGCYYELAQQLLVILGGKQVFNSFMELVIPKVKMFWRKWRSRKEAEQQTMEILQWKRDFYDCDEFGGLFTEYLEIVLQFGFITIFVAAMPFAPLLALLNNIIEIRLDARKFISEYRRPVAMKADGIGIWQTIITTVVRIAVIVNGFLIAFTSDIIPQLFYRYNHPLNNSTGLDGYVEYGLNQFIENSSNPETSCNSKGMEDGQSCWFRRYSDDEYRYKLTVARLSFVIVFDFFVFLIAHLIDLLVPDIPRKLYLKIKKAEFMASMPPGDDEPSN
eukprot:m.57725 g.57725  ORF g.57725 m.57725 type:complete len:680 (+) comp34757_c0_seq15:519-2558(+)